MFMLKMKLYNSDGECRELFLDELYKAQKELAEEMRRKYMYPVLREEGAATRSKATDYAKAEATRARNINKFMPGIEKHLEALPLMMAAAEKEGFNANALWTMQCDAGCKNVKNDIVCLLSHKQCFVCQRASPPMTPYGSPRSTTSRSAVSPKSQFGPVVIPESKLNVNAQRPPAFYCVVSAEGHNVALAPTAAVAAAGLNTALIPAAFISSAVLAVLL